jgi:hypothetical protein
MSDVVEKPGITLARGVCRMLMDQGFAPMTEFPVKTGRRMDVCAIGRKGEIWCVEVKSSRTDFQSDTKWWEYLDWCDQLFFAVPEGFPEEILPLDQGLIRTDAYGAEIVRDAPEDTLSAARRKAVTLRFARLAAERALRGS